MPIIGEVSTDTLAMQHLPMTGSRRLAHHSTVAFPIND